MLTVRGWHVTVFWPVTYNWKSDEDWEELLLLFETDVTGVSTFPSCLLVLNMVVITGTSAAILWPWDIKCEDDGQYTNHGWRKNSYSGSSVISVEGYTAASNCLHLKFLLLNPHVLTTCRICYYLKLSISNRNTWPTKPSIILPPSRDTGLLWVPKTFLSALIILLSHDQIAHTVDFI